MPELTDLMRLFQAFSIIAGIGLLPVLIAMGFWKPRPRNWFPRRGGWRVSWNGFGVFFSFLFCYYLPFFASELLRLSGFFTLLYGPDFFPKAGLKELLPEHHAAITIVSLWSSLVAFPLILLGITAILRTGAEEPRTPLPVSIRRLPANLSLGYLGWFLLTPLCFGVFLLVNLLFIQLLHQAPEKHPITQFSLVGGDREWVLFGLQVMLVAPILEELLFRGILLPWLIQKPIRNRRHQGVIVPHAQRSLVIFILSLVIALLSQGGGVAEAFRKQEWETLIQRLCPMLFVLLTGLLLLLLPNQRWLGRKLRIRSPQQGRAIIASAMFFAAVHPTWPTPIPLFVLGLGLAYLTLRTRNVVSAILLHSLFNGVSVAFLVLGGGA